MGRITNEALAGRIEAIKEYTSEHFTGVEKSLDGIRDAIVDLRVTVNTQNGSIAKLWKNDEECTKLVTEIRNYQQLCPIGRLEQESDERKLTEGRNPVSWIINNWKGILLTVAITSALFMLFPGFLVRVWSIVSGMQIEIGY